MRRGASDSTIIAGMVCLTLLVACVGGPVAFNWSRGSGSNPAPVPLVPGSNPLAQFKGKPLAADVGKAHRDFAAVLAKKPLASTGDFKRKLIDFHALLYAENQNALPGFGVSFEQAWQSSFGHEDGPFDAAKSQAFLAGVADALGG